MALQPFIQSMPHKNTENRRFPVQIHIHRHPPFLCSAASLSVNLQMLSEIYIYTDTYLFAVSPVKISELFLTWLKSGPDPADQEPQVLTMSEDHSLMWL